MFPGKLVHSLMYFMFDKIVYGSFIFILETFTYYKSCVQSAFIKFICLSFLWNLKWIRILSGVINKKSEIVNLQYRKSITFVIIFFICKPRHGFILTISRILSYLISKFNHKNDVTLKNKIMSHVVEIIFFIIF